MDNIDNDFDIFDDDLDILEIIEVGFPRKIYVRYNPLDELDDLPFFRRFRLYKNTVRRVLELIEHELQYPSRLNNCVSPANQLLTCLRVFATGGHLSSVADFIHMDSSTVSRIIVRVSEALARLAPIFITMPTPHQCVREQTKFYNIARFPRVVGVVDGTQIRIQSPGGADAEVYRNRKSYFSINTQVTCNADMKFINVVASWPGSTHDSTIFNNSSLRIRFQQGEFQNCLLLGDSGYPLRDYFLTPLADPNVHGQQLYNESLIRTRILIERTIGIWKRRFPILAYGSRLKEDTTLTAIIATAVLHNVAREMNEPEPPHAEEINVEELDYLIDMGQMPDIPDGINIYQPHQVQQQIINYFSNL